MGLLQATAGPAREILEVDRIDVVAETLYRYLPAAKAANSPSP